MSIGIYKYQNKINGNIYIGLSSNIERRYEQHLSAANSTILSTDKLTTIDAAIRKYGIENFSFEIVELCSEEELDEREIYWIKYYDSYNNGYNNTIGGRSLRGEDHPRAILTENDVWQIREGYKNHIVRREVFKPFLEKGIKERTLIKVWNNENWIGVHSDVYTEENKLWHKQNVGHSEDQIGLNSFDRVVKQEEIDLWVKEYRENGLTINAISKKYHKDFGTIQKYINNPHQKTEVKYRGRTVQNIETGKIFESISAAARWASCGATTLTRHLETDKIAGTVPNTNKKAHWIEIS